MKKVVKKLIVAQQTYVSPVFYGTITFIPVLTSLQLNLCPTYKQHSQIRFPLRIF